MPEQQQVECPYVVTRHTLHQLLVAQIVLRAGRWVHLDRLNDGRRGKFGAERKRSG
jgi:hypothetical protein